MFKSRVRHRCGYTVDYSDHPWGYVNDSDPFHRKMAFPCRWIQWSAWHNRNVLLGPRLVNDNEDQWRMSEYRNARKKKKVPNVLVDSRASIPLPRGTWFRVLLDFKRFMKLVTIEAYSSNSSVSTSIVPFASSSFFSSFLLPFSFYFSFSSAFLRCLYAFIQLSPPQLSPLPLSTSFLIYFLFLKVQYLLLQRYHFPIKVKPYAIPKRAKGSTITQREDRESATPHSRIVDLTMWGEPLCTAIVETSVPMWILLPIVTPGYSHWFNAASGTFLYYFGLYFSAK